MRQYTFYFIMCFLAMTFLVLFGPWGVIKADNEREDEPVWTEYDIPGEGYGKFKTACVDNFRIFVTKQTNGYHTNDISVLPGNPRALTCGS
jgi:hypothetical protein